jgi:large subunit ribosomal protein L7A
MSPDSSVPDIYVAGVTQSKKLIRSSAVKKAYIASDADEKVTGVISDLCREYDVELDGTHTLAELGQMCGIDVKCAACVALK